MHRTRASAVGALLLVVLTTAACSPGENAVVGVTADKDGRPVGVVAVCSGQINSASMWAGSTDESTPGMTRAVEWTPDQPVTDVGIWSVTTGQPWTAQGTPTLATGVTYQIGASDVTFRDGDTTGISSYARAVEFTLADIAALEPGQVRWSGGVDEVTVFREAACRR